MAAMCVVGRTAFSIVPLPNFKPVTAIVMITGIAFGPEAGYLTGALAALLSNFLFGQGPWTPWQMFSWGIVGFLTGTLYRTGIFETVGQAATDEEGKRKKPILLLSLIHICQYVIRTLEKEKKDNTEQNVIEAKELWFRYEKNAPDILRSMDFQLKKGEIFTLLGGNGAGKSTCLLYTSKMMRNHLK